MAEALLLRNVRPLGAAPTDLLIRDGRIAAVGTEAAASDGGSPPETLDGCGALAVAGLVDGHMHLDKTLLGLPWVPHRAGPTVADKIEAEKAVRRELKVDVETQAERLMRLAIAHGTTHIRSHVDIDPERGLAHLEGLLAARERLAGAVSVQLVAFPQSGVMRCPGTAELLEEAVRAGAEVVGGIDPSGIDDDPAGQLDAVFGIAERRGAGVDIHLHDPGELGLHQVRLIAERTRAASLAGRVTISHAHCLGMVGEAQAGRAVEQLAGAGVAVVTVANAFRPALPLQRLHEAGVTAFTGSDGVRDPWTPYGNADMVERAMFVALHAGFRTDEGLLHALGMATDAGARALGLPGYGLEPGCAADLVLLDGENLPEAVVSRRPRRLVLKAGRVVARDGEALV